MVGVERVNEQKNREQKERGGERKGQREGQWGQRHREKDSKTRKRQRAKGMKR